MTQSKYVELLPLSTKMPSNVRLIRNELVKQFKNEKISPRDILATTGGHQFLVKKVVYLPTKSSLEEDKIIFLNTKSVGNYYR